MSEQNIRDEQKEKDILLESYHTARSWSGLITSLSTGVIVFTAVFKSDIAPQNAELQATSWLLASWIVLALAVLSGVAFIAALIPQLHAGKLEKLDLYARWPYIYATLQWVFFFTGIALFAYFAAANLL